MGRGKLNKEETEKYILNHIVILKASDGGRQSKYNKNYQKYTNCPNASITTIDSHSTLGLWQFDVSPMESTSNTPSLNVIKSCIDTLTSKIAQTKVRPFFNVVGGTFDDLRVAKQAQMYFDLFFDRQKVGQKISEAFRDCCIFDTGVIHIDRKTKSIEKALPHQVYISPAEKTYGKLMKAYYERKNYPISLLPDDIRKKVKLKGLEDLDYGIYYDCDAHLCCYTLNGRIAMIEEFSADCIPFVFLYYNNPICGYSTTSVVDALVSIQLEIDIIMSKISDAMELTPGNIILVPDGSDVTPSQISNEIGQIMKYRPTPNMTGSPVSVVTPAFIDGQYISLLEMLYAKAYELIGISQLSAQSKKPQDIESGIALATLEDVESERFETQLNQVVAAWVDVAKICIHIFPKNEDILPPSNTRLHIKWRDIVEADKNMEIQYSASDALSKDPSEKLKQLQALAASGVIPQSRLGQLLEIPDLETGFNIVNNVENAIMTIISDCIKYDDYDIPDYIPLEQLKEEIVNAELSLRALNNTENKKDIKKLEKLYYKADDMLNEFNTAINDEMNYNMQNADEYLDETYGQPTMQTQPMAHPQGTVPQGQTQTGSRSQGVNVDMQEQQGQSTWAGDTIRQ